MTPADWRVPGAPTRFCVVLSPDQDHLVVCTEEIYGAFLQELRDQTADKTLIPEIERQASTLVHMVCLDKVGRLPLPREFTEQAKINDHAVLWGRFSKFDVWPVGQAGTPSETTARAATIVTSKLKIL